MRTRSTAGRAAFTRASSRGGVSAMATMKIRGTSLLGEEHVADLHGETVPRRAADDLDLGARLPLEDGDAHAGEQHRILVTGELVHADVDVDRLDDAVMPRVLQRLGPADRHDIGPPDAERDRAGDEVRLRCGHRVKRDEVLADERAP